MKRITIFLRSKTVILLFLNKYISNKTHQPMKTARLAYTISMIFLLGMPIFSHAAEAANSSLAPAISDDQHYNRAIHIMAMLLVGFGFLMVFVRKYGLSALTATFLLVSISIPTYMLGNVLTNGTDGNEIERLIFAEFGAASLLIAAGAVLGRLKMQQYVLLGLFFIPFYMLNEWIVLNGGLGLIKAGSVVDTGGSIVIHAFGAIFGLGVALSMTTKQDFEKTMSKETDPDLMTTYEIVSLPSKGMFYSHGISEVNVEYLTSKDEDILTTPSLIDSGQVLNILLRRKIKTAGITPEELLSGDRNAIILF
ncbi:MAG: hypothetical protein WCL00_11870, partial [Bacteroidota bacterium]